MNIRIPKVVLKDVEGFSRVWNKGGIAILLDKTALEFARDFANIVLESFVRDQIERSLQAQAMKEQQNGQQTNLPPITPPAPQPKSSLIIEG